MDDPDDTVTVSRLEDHNRGSDPTNGPDYCVECSKALQWWVPWPCGYVRAVATLTAEADHLRAALSEPSEPDAGFVRCPFCDYILPPGSVLGTGDLAVTLSDMLEQVGWLSGRSGLHGLNECMGDEADAHRGCAAIYCISNSATPTGEAEANE